MAIDVVSWPLRSARPGAALRRRWSSGLALAVVGTTLGLLLAVVPAPRDPGFPGRFDGARAAAATLRGDAVRSDFAADYVGARALLDHRDPYPRLAGAFREVGLDWQVFARSTHPPTAEVLALPLAGLSWQAATTAWAWIMLLVLGLSAWALGLRLPWASAAAVLSLVVWPPAAWSLGQLTPLWLLGAALAWRWRDRPLAAGAAVGLAAVTKLFPALLLVPFLLRRRWRAVTGCAAVAGLTLLPALLLYPGSVSAFVHAERAESRRQELRGDNGSLVMSAYKHSGWLAVAGAVLLVAAIGVLAARSRRGTAGDADLHARWLWLSVALIPLAWIYSLLPLAPVIARGLLSRRLPSAMASIIAFALPVIGMPYGYRSAPYIALTIAFAGLSVLLASRPTLVGARPSTVTSRRADAAGRVP